MIDIQEYILKDKQYRQDHIDLNELCLERGGNGSTEFKGLLADFLNTTIPCRGVGQKILLCHACGNAKCSNVRHLYWGTPSENTHDAKVHGTWKCPYERTLNKYGVDGMKEIASRAGIAAKESRLKNKDPLFYEKYRHFYEGVDFNKRGWCQRLSKMIGVSHTQVRRIAKKLNLIC